MKNKIFGLFALLLLVAFASCDREGPMDKFQQDIPWALCVTAVLDDIHKQQVAGATVEIYRTEEDMQNGTNVYLTGTTNQEGEAIFTYADFNKNNQGVDAVKGVYFVLVKGNGVEKEAVTEYLLMNSGMTTMWVQLV